MKLKDRLPSWTICTMNTNTRLPGKFSKRSRTKSHLPPPMWEKTPQNAAKHGLLISNHSLSKEVDETCSPGDAFFSNKVADCLLIKRGPFEVEELKRSVKKLQNRKSPWPDKIPAIIWKSPLFYSHLLHFSQRNLETNQKLSLILLSCHCLRKVISQALPTTEVSLCPILHPISTTQCFLIELPNTSILYSEETKRV